MATPQKTVMVCSMMVLVVLTVELGLSTAAIHRILDCSKGTHGCCPDNVTFAYGPNNKDCTAILCYDKVPDCDTRKSKDGCASVKMYELCTKTCGKCVKSAITGPSEDCVNSKYGCCYDDVTYAIKKDKRPGVGCPRCRNLTPVMCKRYGTSKHCADRHPRKQQFLKAYCFKQCGICTNFKEVEKRIEAKGWRDNFY